MLKTDKSGNYFVEGTAGGSQAYVPIVATESSVALGVLYDKEQRQQEHHKAMVEQQEYMAARRVAIKGANEINRKKRADLKAKAIAAKKAEILAKKDAIEKERKERHYLQALKQEKLGLSTHVVADVEYVGTGHETWGPSTPTNISEKEFVKQGWGTKDSNIYRSEFDLRDYRSFNPTERDFDDLEDVTGGLG
jgi:hypothetical protein